MKTLLFYASVTITLLIFLSSCTKEKPDSPLAVSPQSDEQLVSQVHWFMDAAKDVKEGKYLKSGEKMFLDSALYYISATLNYKYGYHTVQYEQLKLDTVMVTIPILAAEGKTYVVDALAGYNNAVSKIRFKYSQNTATNKKTVGFIIQYAGYNTTNDSVKARVITQIGYGDMITQLTAMYDWQFGETDQYWWLENSQNCYNGTGGFGAPNIIENTLMFGLCPAPPPNCRYWFPIIDEIEFIPTNYEVDSVHDNFCDYKIYYASGSLNVILTNQVQCLGLDTAHPGIHEMSFYCTGLLEIIQAFLTSNQKQCQKLKIGHFGPDLLPPNYTIYAIGHKPILFYGNRKLICSEPVYPLAIDNPFLSSGFIMHGNNTVI